MIIKSLLLSHDFYSVIFLYTLQILDTQLAVCRGAVGEAGVDDVIPKWDPSHLDLRHRPRFSM